MTTLAIQGGFVVIAAAQVVTNPISPVRWTVLVGVVAVTALTAWAIEKRTMRDPI